ncbi:MAG: hypothetical protein ACSLE1_09130 [Sphingobium sp.]
MTSQALPSPFAKIIQHPSFSASAVFLLSGAAFAVGNLLLARSMSVEAFGQFALALALFNIFVLVLPLGIDQFLLRHRIDPDARLIGMVAMAALVGGGAVSAAIVAIAGLSLAGGVALAVSIASGAIIVTANAALRSTARNRWGLAFTTGASWLLLLIGGIALLFPPDGAAAPILAFAAGNAAMAVVAVAMALEQRTIDAAPIVIDWHETLTLLGVAAISTLALQVERLLVPAALGLDDLAIFAVLASTAIFPFRLLVAGTGFSLVPRLRRASGRRERRSIVLQEVLFMGGVALLASLVILIATPIVVPWLTGGAYAVSYALAGAACLNGVSKLAQAMTAAIVTGCGNKRDIAQLNGLSVLWLVVACASGLVGAHFGLIGLLVSISVGGLAVSLFAVPIARRAMAT